MHATNRIVYGYGFFAAGISDDKFRSFILAHANTIFDNHEDYAEQLVTAAAHDHRGKLEDAFTNVRC